MTTSSLENGNFFFFMYFHFPISQIKSICAQDYMVTIKKKKKMVLMVFQKKNFYAKKKCFFQVYVNLDVFLAFFNL